MADRNPERSTRPRPRRGRRLLRTLLRAAALALVLLVLASGVGFAYESNASRADAREHRAPGRLVDVGGHRLHLYCAGRGAPTVVLEAGLAESSASWEVIQRRLSAHSRVCSYDRAGYAWSQEGPSPRTAERLAGELHALLAASGEAGPYVLVAHSFGGNVVRVFADRRRSLTAGLVLIDVTDETALTALRISRPLMAVQLGVNQFVARVGLLRLRGDAFVPPEATPTARANATVVYGSGSMAAARAEAWASVDSAAQVAATVRPGAWDDLPVTVIVPAGQPEEDARHARSLAALSSRGRLVTASTTEHYVQNAQPDLVLAEIARVAAG
ncbi:alpha/beta fold hydrolase [Streptosporangium sp. NPDC049376]|uniref:alpha/beta fold hydrolase n=1 Tax=Streptosporangium sp. NPDC049376 TaxID=3366192 RepID=UPI00378FC99B